MIYNLPLKLRTLRKQRGMTQGDVAEKIGIDRTTYAAYEHGSSEPSYSTLGQIAKIFGVHLHYFDFEDRKDESSDLDYVSDVIDEFHEHAFKPDSSLDSDDNLFKLMFSDDGNEDIDPFDTTKLKFYKTHDLAYTALRALPLSKDEQVLIYAYRLLPTANKESVLSEIEETLSNIKQRDKK